MSRLIEVVGKVMRLFVDTMCECIEEEALKIEVAIGEEVLVIQRNIINMITLPKSKTL